MYEVFFLKHFNLNKGLGICCYSVVSRRFQLRLNSVDVIFNCGFTICHISYSSYFDITIKNDIHSFYSFI